MDIIEYPFDGVPDFLRQIQKYRNEGFIGWIYRGQADKKWFLVPKAGRDEYFDSDYDNTRSSGAPPQDLGKFNYWREQSVAYSRDIPNDQFECLAYAQHYGLATRLLDWTTNPLVALYFASETHLDADGAVYCYLTGIHVVREDATLDQKFPRIPRFNPRPFDKRVIAQQAVFTVHQQPQMPLTPAAPGPDSRMFAPDNVDLVRFVFSGKAKPTLLKQLTQIGIDRKRLFPDLDGLSEFINQQTRSRLKSKKERMQTAQKS